MRRHGRSSGRCEQRLEKHGFVLILAFAVAVGVDGIVTGNAWFFLIGSALAVITAYGKGIRVFELTRDGFKFGTWSERLLMRIETRLQIEPAQLRLEGQLAHVKVEASDHGRGSETATRAAGMLALEKAHEAESPEELADRVVELIEGRGGSTFSATFSGEGRVDPPKNAGQSKS